MPEITKVYIIGNRTHSGKTLLAAYLADALQCELDSPEHTNTPEFYSRCVQLAKAGWFYAPRIVAVTEIKVRLIRRANLRDIQRQLITYNRDENPFLEIIIVQPDHRLHRFRPEPGGLCDSDSECGKRDPKRSQRQV